MRFSTRELVSIAVFGALWGAVEISLGTVLKTLHVPLSGVVLAAIGLMVALIGRVFVPKRGATLFTGLIAMLLKLFSLGGVVLGPMVGIIAEAVIAEIVLSLAKRPTRFIFTLAGGLGVLWTLIHPFFTGLLFFGREPFEVWLDLLNEGHRVLGLSEEAAIWIVLGLVALRLVIGGLAGLLAWGLGGQLRTRLDGRDSVSP